MKKILLIIAFFLFSYTYISNAYSADNSEFLIKNRKIKTVPGELLIKFKSNASLEKESIKKIHNQYGIKKIKNIFDNPKKIITKNNLTKWYKVCISQNENLQELTNYYKNSPDVEFVEPNYQYDIFNYPDDTYYKTSGTWGQPYPDMWALYKIKIPSAWEIEKGKADIIVAIVDTGIDYNHEDISNNIWSNLDEIPNNGIDDDNNGYIDDTLGWNFVDDSNQPKDGKGHGTHIAGTVAGVTNNNKGISGITQYSKIMAVKGINDTGWGNAANLANCITYAADNGAKIINLSWGGYGTSRILKEALDYADSKGCLIVAAAGNSNEDAAKFFPANYEKAITVAATDPEDKKSFFSNYGTKVDIAAPGVDILSLKAAGVNTSGIVGENYFHASGTSMAAPHVCGVAALIFSRHPDYTNKEVASIIAYSADDIGDPGKDIYFGWGRLNAYKALLASDGTLPIDNNISIVDTPSDHGYSINISWPKHLSPEVKGYKIYYSKIPFSNVLKPDVTYLLSSPADNPQAESITINNLDNEYSGYYFSIIANIFEEYQSREQTSAQTPISTIEPTYPVHNIINTLSGDDTIFAGFDLNTKAILPQGNINNAKTLDILKVNPADFPNQPKPDSFNSLVDEETTTSYKELVSTLRQFKTSSDLEGIINLVIPYQITYSSSPINTHENTLRIYQFNTIENNWEMVSGLHKIDKQSKTITCEIKNPDWQYGKTYRIFPAMFFLQNLNAVTVYPNPFKPNSLNHHKKIIFGNLTRQATIKIYNLAGELVFKDEETDNDGKYEWQAVNETGENLASGIYIYLITNKQNEKKKGKIGIIR